MPQIVEPDPTQPRSGANQVPWLLQISAGLVRCLARDHKGSGLWQGREHRLRRAIQDDCFATGLGIGQQQQASLEVDMVPAEMQDFAQPGPCEVSFGLQY